MRVHDVFKLFLHTCNKTRRKLKKNLQALKQRLPHDEPIGAVDSRLKRLQHFRLLHIFSGIQRNGLRVQPDAAVHELEGCLTLGALLRRKAHLLERGQVDGNHPKQAVG